MRKLAVSESSSASESDVRDIVQVQNLSKKKGKSKRRGKEAEGRSTAKTSKGEGKEMEREGSHDRAAKSNGKGKKKVLAISDDEDEVEEFMQEDDAQSVGTASIGSLYGADDEEGLGAWTENDGKTYLIPSEEQDEYEVDIVIRWRWHPRLQYPQYRVKWTDYPDLYNSWEPINSFDGDLVDQFWRDLEYAGLGKRPKGWDKERDDEDAMLESDATDRAIRSIVADRRRRARKRKRKDIRKDRIEMRKAYARKGTREKAEAQKREQELNKKLEQRLKRKREQDEAAASAVKQHAKKVINPAATIQRGESSRMDVMGRPTSNAAGKTEAASGTSASHTSSTPNKLALAASFMTESDAKLKADRKKAREEAVQKTLSLAPSTQPLSTSAAKDVPPRPSTATSTPSATTAAAPKEGGVKVKGSFKGAHRDRKKIMPMQDSWNPLDAMPRSIIARPSVRPPLTSGLARPQTPAVTPSLPATTVTTPSGKSTRPVEAPQAEAATNGAMTAARTASPTPSLPPLPPPPTTSRASLGDTSAAPLPSPLIASATRNAPRGAIKLGGVDPRRRGNPTGGRVTFGDVTSTEIEMEEPPSGQMDLPSVRLTSPPVHPGAASPVHPLQSPLQTSYLPQDDQQSFSSAGQQVLELTAVEKQRAEEAMARWKFDEDLKARITSSYNFVTRYSTEDKEHYRLICHVIGLLKGGRAPALLEKHKDPKKRGLVWIPSAKLPLTPIERQTLALPNFRFMEYHPNTGVAEIWPAMQRKVIMYTFAALIIRLVEQCYTLKTDDKWSVGGSAVMIHPWQKEVLQQLKDADLVATFLTRILGIQDDLANKEFAIVERSLDVLNDFEEVPLEWTNADANGKTIPMALEMDMSELLLAVDLETSATLHRLQYDKRLEWRSFTLIMAKTALVGREVPTLYEIM